MALKVMLGDRLPTVALAQARLVDSGERDVAVDCVFDAKTEAAVRRFQQRSNLPVTGAVDQLSWDALTVTRGAPLPVVDVIDGGDLLVLWWRRHFLDDGRSDVMVNAGMTRGARFVVNGLVARHSPRSIALLRIHGHGSAGQQWVAGGDLGFLATSYVSRESLENTSFSADQFGEPSAVSDYARLGRIMKPYGSIELHGCRVGFGARGRSLLSSLARVSRVPVSAALTLQHATESDRFVGPTITFFPDELTRTSWAERTFSQCEW